MHTKKTTTLGGTPAKVDHKTSGKHLAGDDSGRRDKTLAGAQAGSVNLMSSPFRVPADRNPEVLRVLLRLTRDDRVRLGPVVPRPAGSSAPSPR